LGNLSNLNHLMLYGNQLTGNIPTSLTNLTDLTSMDIGYNALHTDDNTLRIFLDSKDPDWVNTQTIAPENVTVAVTSDTSIEMSWIAITYTSDSGGYRVFYSTTPGGPYTLFSTTADKSASQMEVTGLSPNATYYFVVQTRTEPHSTDYGNENTVDSEYSVEVSAKTTGNDADTDDDGLADGTEDANHNGIVDSGETDPCNVDTDGDGIQDGTEAGLTLSDVGTDTDTNVFIFDADPNTTTDPLSSDTDQDGISDGEEDANHNGMVDEGETDPASADRYVSNSGSNLTGDGTSGIPWQTIQFAIDQVSDGGTIHVADGTYTGSENKNINFGGKAITVKSQNGPNNCIIDCEGDGQGFYFYGWESADSVVAGFTITSGQATYGGGIYCAYSSPTIKNCIITGNNGETHGGGIYIAIASPVIENCVISGNTSGNGGGVFCHWSSLATIANCTISDNVVTYWGGGIYCSNDSSPTIRGCSIRANRSGYGGGGIACFSSASITNCIISENSSEFSDAGGICIRGFSTSVNITNCTISKNTADYGGGISCTHDASATLTNSILWNNVATGGSEIALGNPGHSFTPLSFEVQYSDIKGGEASVYVQPGSNLNWGDGNINADPMFFGDDYSLKIDSPCIDTGDPSSPFDPDGTRADMGALPYSDGDDNDGMPADWEIFNGLNPYDPTDATGDLDWDGLNNLDEYLNHTNPNNPDTDGDGVSDGDEVHHGTDPNTAEIITTNLSRDTITVSLTGNNRIFVEVANLFCESKAVNFSLIGINADWYTITAEDQAFTLAPFEKRMVTVQMQLPQDCTLTAQDYPFNVETAWQEDCEVQNSSNSGLLTITSVPNVYPLALPHDTKLAANRILLAWKSDVACDSNVYYRKLGDDDFILVPVATQSDEHRITLDDLDFFTYYEFYTENISSCGEVTVSRLYQARTGKAIKFVDDVKEFWIDRDYNQLVTLSITNTDIIEHTFSLSVTNENNDIQVGFVGDGTPQREATLLAGESRDVELVINANDALMTDYNIYLKMVSDEGHFDSFLETVHAVIHVRPFVANLAIQSVDSTPGTMSTRFRLMNYGDTLSDIEVFVDAQNRTITTLNPAIHHVRLDNGGYVEFDISADSYTTGTVYAHSGTYTVSAPFEIGCEPGTDLTTYTVNDVSIVAVIQDWYCTNKMHAELPFAVPRGFSHEDLSETALEVRFELPMAYEKYDPHDVTISINGSQVAVFENEIPQGTYVFRFPTSIIHLGADAPAKNILTINASGITPGHYIVATDFKVMLNVDEMDVTLCVPFPKPPDPPIEKYPPKVTLPDPHTLVVSISPVKKFRPGQTVSVSTVLSNDDSSNNPPHQGLLTVQLTNDSANGVVPAISRTFDLTIAGGQQRTLSFNYTIPPDADDIDYTFSATFQNNTLNETMPYASSGFWVRTPLIMVHGMMGSRLHEVLAGNQPYEVWSGNKIAFSPCDDFMEDLKCPDKEGSPSANCDIQATSVMRELVKLKLFGKKEIIFGDVYNELEGYLENEKYKLYRSGADIDHWFDLHNIAVQSADPEDIFYFVYDWRQDNALTAQDLNTFVTNVTTAENYPNVNIVAHSMGGLVCKSMLHQHPEVKDHIEKLIFLGTPNLGAVETFSMFKHGLRAPRFGTVIPIEKIEANEELISAYNSLKSLLDIITDPTGWNLLTGLTAAIEDSMEAQDPELCSDALKIVNYVFDGIDLFTGDPASLIGSMYDYYNLDKDMDGIRDYWSQQIVPEFPSAYQLLPSAEYHNYFPGGYYVLDGQQISTTTDRSIDAELLSIPIASEMMLDLAEDLHGNIDNGVAMPEDTYSICGCKNSTAKIIDETSSPHTLRFVPGDGDGTVPIVSALYLDVKATYAAQYAMHMNLPSHPGIRLLIRSLLKGEENDFPTSSNQPVETYSEGFCGLPSGVRIKIRPSSGSATYIGQDGGSDSGTASETVDQWPRIKSVDVPGKAGFTGYTGNTIHVGILGSDYRVTHDGVEIFVPDGAVYTLEFKGVDAEYIDVKLQMMTEGGVIKTYVFYDIPIDVNGKGVVDINLTDMMTDPVLRLDQDGDGNFETTGIPPSYVLNESQSIDFTDPVTTANITGVMGQDDWYTSNVSINLAATDNTGGSGILATIYRFQGDEAFTDYTGSIQITEPGNYTLTYYSIDKNLNKETEKVLEFKIDNKTPQVLSVTDVGRFNLGTTSFSASLDVQVGTSGLQDIRYSLGTAPGSTDIVDWTSAGAVSEIQATELSLVESCTEQIYINVQAVNSAGLSSEIASSDGVVVLESGGDPDGDGYDNESEVTAGSNPCNEISFPGTTVTQLKKGFNFIAIPAEVEYQKNLREWLPILGDSSVIEKVLVYDGQAGKFITLIPGNPLNESFMLQGGEGLIVYAKQDKEIAFTSVLCSTHDLKPGFNLAGFACPANGYSAYQLLNDLGRENVSSIQRYSTEKGAFETAGFTQDGQLAGVDFSIVAGEGYFIFIRKN